ncbi:hypothetical protein [Arthrobacter sp. cf158]|uniref:hypothetical protein n=1 Tax=Arthrobacter sp. cf158 TaxID=1761744 RepID=UPI000B8971B8|nr:hypothetical protein [Arthrobacter sp. cf158]
MTIMLDSEGTAFSNVSCFRCEQAGPHWGSRHSGAGIFACRRCFATFADQESSAVGAGGQAPALLHADGQGMFESK